MDKRILYFLDQVDILKEKLGLEFIISDDGVVVVDSWTGKVLEVL